ncbi:MAG: gamma-glutamylcyclotransferase [Rhizobiaceae bacterium]|nr:gamma-glutamylcyclotransferase [Rhizobiaceae bacterium]
MTKQMVGYFGFGSLVNTATLRTDYIETIPVALKGWRRHWQGRPAVDDPEIALLSIHRYDNAQLHGLIVVDRLENLEMVDERERGYQRVQLSHDDFLVQGRDLPVNLPTELYVYVANPASEPDSQPPLLQSYLDAVMQGYLNEYGSYGLAHFIETTIGFERSIILDRNEPRYPRAIELDQASAELFDKTLRGAGVLF